MNMTRNKGGALIAVFIVLVAYNVIVFLLPFDRHNGFWMGYGFSMLALIIAAVIGFYVLGRGDLRSKFYGLPLLNVVWIYVVVQLIVGFIQMILPENLYRYGIVVNAILLGICLIGLIGLNATKEEVERIDRKVKEKVFYIRSLQVDVEILESKTTDSSLRAMLKDLAETIRYSDPMSSPQLATLENKIENKTIDLTNSIYDVSKAKELCDELQQMLAERNRKCRLLK